MIREEGELFEITPFNAVSEEIYKKKEHALIGISPFNGYFKVETMSKLFNWALLTFDKVDIIIPDKISFYSLLGFGYSEKTALERSIKEDKKIEKRVFEAMNNLEIDLKKKSSILYLSELSKTSTYLEVYQACMNRYESDFNFKNLCLSFTEKYLLHSSLRKEEGNLKIEEAIKYLISEMPFFLNTPYILGVKSSLIVYHSSIGFSHFFQKEGLVSEGQGFISVKYSPLTT